MRTHRGAGHHVNDSAGTKAHCSPPLLLLILPAILLALLGTPISVATAQTIDEGGAPEEEQASSGPAYVISERTEKSTAYSREFQLSDGTRRVTVSLLPVNYKDADGAWQPIDVGIESSDKNGFAFENTKNSFTTYFSGDGASRGTVRLVDGVFALEIGPGANDTAEAAADSGTRLTDEKLEYANLFPSTSARYSILPGALKEELILSDSKAPALFQFRIKAENLYANTRDDGSIVFFDSGGFLHFVLPQPYAKDSASDAAFVNLSHSVRADGDGYLYEVVLDAAWLEDPARVFPVVVDPTVTTDDMAVDTYISSANPTTCYSSSEILAAYGTGTSAQKDILLRFNLPELGADAAIQYAGITLIADAQQSFRGTSTLHS